MRKEGRGGAVDLALVGYISIPEVRVSFYFAESMDREQSV
jgi:hypothetical protein